VPFFPLVFFLIFASNQPWWSVQTSGLDTNLRGVSVVSDQSSTGHDGYVIWAAGSNGVIVLSTNDGSSWKQLHVAGGSALDFRDIEAFDAKTAYVMSSGDGDKSRIYGTNDGGNSWKLEYSDKRPGFFLDALACESATHCFALSDPVEGNFLILATEDGEHWHGLPRDGMPPALPKEGAFAGSGTALAVCFDGSMYFVTGGTATARIFRSKDHGRSWTASQTPMPANASSGIFSIACNGSTVVAVGGDYKEPSNSKQVALYSHDRGDTWQLAAEQPGGYRSAVASFSDGDFAAVGPNGSDISHDEGVHWQHTDHLNLNAMSFDGTHGWGVGAKGTIARFKSQYSYEIRIKPPGEYKRNPQAIRAVK
jgi:photosystem II stability/assembly factor-like uncharacterized protein